MTLADPATTAPTAAPDTRHLAPDPGSKAAQRSPRLTDLPIYVFAWLDELKAAARARGASLIDLGMGNPDLPTPAPIVAAMAEAWADPRNHGYPPFRGTERFLGAAAAYMERRFGTAFDPATEILCLSGAKEGIAHLTMGLSDPGIVSLVPDIYYPVHGRATGLVGGEIGWLPLRADRGFLPDLAAVPDDLAGRARLLLLNYPHNPTGAVASREFLAEAVAFCRRHGIVLVSDLAYAEITFDGYVAPSVFEIEGAREVAIEFHSLSKSCSMAGSRIGFAVGGPELIDVLYAVRTNMGYGTPGAIQAAAAFALDHMAEFAAPIRDVYRARSQIVVDGFRSLGWSPGTPRATMFVWLPVPTGFTAQAWTAHLIDTAGVVVTPGNAFGPGGDRFFRISLVADSARLEEAFTRLRAVGIHYDPTA